MAVQFSENTFEQDVLNSDVPVLVDFYADWCGPCKMMAPIIDELSKEYEGKVLIGKLNVDDNQSIAAKYRVMSIPTLILFKNGEAAKTIVGAVSKKEVQDMINSYL